VLWTINFKGSFRRLPPAVIALFCVCSLYVSAQSVPGITKDKNGRPNWVDKPGSAFNASYYVFAVGYGNSRRQADADAFANLTGLFGQSVKSHISDVETYKERIVNGKIEVVSTQDTMQAVKLSSSMDSLIGAQINDRWEDTSKKIFYAVAVMEKAPSIKIYSDLLDANVKYIDTILAMPDSEKTSFEAIARYRLAGSIADMNVLFAVVISVLGGPDKRGALKSGDDYRFEANNLASRIPVHIIVQNDFDGRIKSAFARVFSAAGFRTGNNNSRYVLNVQVSITPADFNNTDYKFARYVTNAHLTDTKTNSVIFPFNINGREGHATQSEANVRAIGALEKAIQEQYTAALNEYLSSALPKK
jgi:protein-disulfide isomerase